MRKMLEYQKLDIELSKIAKSKANNEDKANLAKCKSYILDFQNKAHGLENGAKTLVEDYDKLKKQYQSNIEKIQALTKTSMEEISLEKVDAILYQINSLSGELCTLERNINNILLKIKESLKNFETIKKNMSMAKEKYNECKARCEKFDSQLEPRIAEIQGKMKALEKELDPDLYAKYKAAKADKVFPVFVPLDNGHCFGCRVELPTAKINKIKSEGSIVCECHRVIYNR